MENRTEWVIAMENAESLGCEAAQGEGYEGSMQQLLQQNVGCWASCDFLIGTTQFMHREGILHAVGSAWMCLCDPGDETHPGCYTVCDVYSLKFAQLYEHDPGQIDTGTEEE